ncbi:unnamed protein product [Brachionus calyciflorus]|uniref:WDR63 n=1 Tax=Brachionus calyciflorus TaxID=104777 RepID=A0A813MAD9_9BILA|nr:unnamed protein product [Brachionus calyciflorus]
MSKPASRASQKPATSSTSRLSNGSAKPRDTSAQKPNKHNSNKKSNNPFDEYTIDCPPGLYRLFLSSGTQSNLNIRSDEDITQEDNFRSIPKQAILDDIYNKQALSDFSPLRKQIEEYPEDEITLVYDYEFQHDKNFYICLNIGLKELIHNPPIVLPPEPQKEPPKYQPPESKPWVSQGSEKEIDEHSFKDKRPLLKFNVKIAKESLKRNAHFIDIESDDKKNLNISIQPFEDSSFQTKMIETEIAIQAAPMLLDSSAQTIWRYPKNAATQSEPRFLDKKECEKILGQEDIKSFINQSIPELESALQQNILFNAFENDWELLGDEMSSIGGPGDMHLKEYQSFSDIHNSKNKVVTCVQWHPELKGIVAMSLAENFNFYDRMDNISKSVITPSMILIWSFFDPIQPKLFLEAPDDVFSFAFSHSDPNIIAGGCINGQVVLWDISPWEERIKNPRGDHRDKDLFIPGFEDETYFQTPRIRYCALSSLEHGHSSPITDIFWLPDHFEIDRMGFPTESKDHKNCQLMTAATDNQILFWDTRSKSANTKKKDSDLPMNVPDTFKHLGNWRPLLKVSLPCSDPGGDFAPTKFSIAEKQGDKSTIELEDKLEIEKKEDPNKGQFVAGHGKPTSGKGSRLLQHLNTRISVGTEDGQYVYVDWLPQKDADTSKLTTSKAEWYQSILDGPIVAMKRSPFFKDIILIAGGTGFNIWREKVFSGALLQTKSFSKRICDAEWSPTRPGVFFIAKSDGTVDIWDLLDRTHVPILTQSISINKLTYLSCKIVASNQQLIALGDSMGTLHIMEVPWSLRRVVSGEYQAVKAYFARETERRDYVKQRWDFREEEKREIERQNALKAGLGPPHIPTEDEITFRLKGEYNEYLQFEAAILRELGLRDDDDDQPAAIAVN